MTSEATVSVRGEAILDAEPELAVVTIAAEARGGDHSTALSLLSERVKAVSDVVTRYAAGIERSETSRLTVYPELAHKKTEKVRRYVGHCTLSLTVHDFGVLSDLLVAASTIELVTIDGPWWRMRSNSEVYRRARLAAAADALTRARDYAEAFGAQLTGLLEVADQGMSPQHEGRSRGGRFAMLASSSAASPAPEFALEPVMQEIVGSVEARFTISPPDLATVVPPPR